MLRFALERAAVTLAVAAAWLASARVNFGTTPDTALQPVNGAFGIWVPIFLLLVWGGMPVVWVVASLVCATAWGWLAAARWWRAAAAALGATAALAWVALWHLGRLRAASGLVPGVGVGLYAGWTTVATVLAISIAGADVPRWALPLVALGVTGASVASGQPAPCVAVAWAAALQRTTDPSSLGALGVALLGLAGAIARTLA